MIHHPADLGAHALGLLDDVEARALEAHLTGCAACRAEFAALHATAAALGTLPPETFLPPGTGDGRVPDLALARAARRVREEASAHRRRRTLGLVAAAVVTAVALLGGGALLGRAVEVGAVGDPAPAGTRTLVAQEGAVSLSAAVVPANGWVRVAATVRGIPAGERCTIIVVGSDGTEAIAGSWLTGTGGGGTIDGSAIVDPAEVFAVAIRDAGGTDLVTART